MRQIKIAIWVLTIGSCFITLLIYYLYHIPVTKQYEFPLPLKKIIASSTHRNVQGTPFKHIPLNEIYNDQKDYSIEFEERTNKKAQMLNTPGCQIPLAMVSYDLKKNTKESSCGKRAVYLTRNDIKFRVMIKDKILREFLKSSRDYYCCYRFFKNYPRPGYQNTKIRDTPCRIIENGNSYNLESDFVNVLCFEYGARNASQIIYEDVYAFAKKINIPKHNKTSCKVKYNVLMLGMDSMSLPRFVQTMSRTVNYFKDNFWLGFRGYHKVGDNTFPNLMAAFMGRNLSDISKTCLGKMDECNQFLIWNIFKATGYVTAYGEDYLRLPDTFSNSYAFHRPPTHHYMRPFFVKGETEINNKSLVCAGKVPSGSHLLEFALDFVTTYKDTPFFGLFWMNSYSHNENSRPQDADKMFENFFNRLSYTGALTDTFVIFFSDHGIRFGTQRSKVESYYDERMPILFIWTPLHFKWKHPKESKNLAYNQFRLTTHYDLFNTLQDINRISNCTNSTSSSIGCPKCQSLFNVVSSNRTCQDVTIHDKWCSCHKLYPLDIEDTEGMKVVRFVVDNIKSMIKRIETKRCWACSDLSLKNVTRIHFYYDNAKIKLIYVVAFTTSPGNVSYEASVSRIRSDMKIVGPVSVISAYRGLGKCVVPKINDSRTKDRLFCVCQKTDNCRINSVFFRMPKFPYTKIIVLVSWIAISLIYYKTNLNGIYTYASKTYNRSSNSNFTVRNNTYKGSEKYLINTPGCYIPNYAKTFHIKETKFHNKFCGVRAVSVNKISDNKIEFRVDKVKMNTYSKGKTYQCCYKFGSPLNVSGNVNLKKLEYSTCILFQNGSRVELEQEIVTVSCHSKQTNIYEDAYIILKKHVTSINEKNTKSNPWNVLILGMDTMSRARLFSSMPQTAQYLREHNWLDFRGYQKVGYNTFPNVMSFMTGKNVSVMYKACSHGLEECKKFLIWEKFKKAGYTTAYGEDFLRLPDTFSKYNGFLEPPTDHYMRPFFLTGETISGNYVCTKKLASPNHILDYAYQFSNAYKTNKFYGMFWINSCSHNGDNSPTIYDEDFVSFFKKMYKSGVMDNTFILFLSDHGIRYGRMRLPAESYYEERLPMCLVWVPKKFKEIFTRQYMNLQLNQDRLVTPYDFYLTMLDILKVTQGSNEVSISEACPLCKSLFKEISVHRTCADAGVDEKWCCCHNMSAVDKTKSEVIRSLQVAEEALQKRAFNTITTPCTKCHKFKVKSIIRSHSYEDFVKNKTYYVLAFVVEPGSIAYEAVVQKYNSEFSLVQYMDTITPYNTRGFCVKNSNDRGFCVCEKLKNCKTNR
ncbi:uncharacterized protein [Epargyreus clarus]|uniref:uncharacterized protein n=1 Tax=Epargyreus clarus TaxID=520877 RepID=UPI003C2B0D6B